MSHMPLVSVIVPTYNRPDYLETALLSLAWQLFRDFEVIVVNDRGQEVWEVVKKFTPLMRVTLLTHVRNMGLAAARNTGLAAARGAYIAYLDDDDIFYDLHLQILVDTARSTGKKVVYTTALCAMQKKFLDVYRTTSRKVTIKNPFDRGVLAERNLTPVNALFHERACLERSGRFAEYLPAHEDWDLWQRMARHYDFAHVPVLTCEFTHRDDHTSMSRGRKEDMRQSWVYARWRGMLMGQTPPVPELEAAALETKVRSRDQRSACRVSVVLTLGASAAFQPAKLAAACEQLGAAQLDTELVLVGSGLDAGDLDALADRLQPLFRLPVCRVAVPADAGRVLAANLGAAHALGTWLLFMEEEVVPELGCLHALLKVGEANPAAGAVGGVMRRPGWKPVFGGALTPDMEPVYDTAPWSGNDEARAAPCLPGQLLLVRRDAFDALEGFDPTYAPAHYADADLCLRLRARGRGCVVAKNATYFWNSGNRPLQQSAAGLLSRRTFQERWGRGRLEIDLEGGVWSQRPALWPSDGSVPSTDRIRIPEELF